MPNPPQKSPAEKIFPEKEAPEHASRLPEAPRKTSEAPPEQPEPSPWNMWMILAAIVFFVLIFNTYLFFKFGV